MPADTNADPPPGLCGRCRHARRVPSDRGRVFYLCGLSAIDSRFPKYPRLPVLRCEGFGRAPSVPSSDDATDDR
jgi:hypothetical protein